MLKGHKAVVTCLDFSPTHNQIVSGSWDKTMRLWDIKTGALITVYHTQDSTAIWSLRFSNDGQHILAGEEKIIRLWDKTTGKVLKEFIGHEKNVRGVRYLNDDEFISISMDGTIRVWRISTGKEIYNINGHNKGITCMHLFKDTLSQLQLITGSEDKLIKIWDLTSRQMIAEITGFADIVGSVSRNNVGDIVTGSWDQAVRYWKPVTGHNNTRYHLGWSSHSILTCDDCDISGVIGLSSINKQLLQQLGARGNPAGLEAVQALKSSL